MTSLFSQSNPLSIFLAISTFLGILAVLVSVHEASHAWMANKLGDPTAKHQGRVSLNPLVHIDPIGTVILPLILLVLSSPFLIGWAKPTPFNPWNLKNPRRDSALISFAGPVSNFIIAIFLALPFRLGILDLPTSITSLFNINLYLSTPVEIISQVVFGTLLFSLILGLFNLIPIAPLDGFKVVGGLLPKDLALSWQQLEKIGPFLLIGLIIFGGSVFQSIIGGLLGIFLMILLY